MPKAKETPAAKDPGMMQVPKEQWDAMVARQGALEEKINAQNQTPADRERKVELIPEADIKKFIAKEPSLTRFYWIIETPVSYHGNAPDTFQVKSLFPDKVSSESHLGVADQTQGVELRFKHDTSPAWGSDILNDERTPKFRVKYAELAECNGVKVTEKDIAKYKICDPDDLTQVNRFIRSENAGWGTFTIEECRRFMEQHMLNRMFDDARDGKNWTRKVLTEEQLQGWVDLTYTPLLEERRNLGTVRTALGLASRAQRARGELGEVG